MEEDDTTNSAGTRNFFVSNLLQYIRKTCIFKIVPVCTLILLDFSGAAPVVVDKNQELLDDIRTFVAFGASVDGRATTDEIVAQFRDRLPEQTSALFKQMLMQICEFHRLPSGQGIWKLIPELNW